MSTSHKRLEGKVAMITGGASGIGETTARLFADHGVRAIVLVDIQDEKGMDVATSIGLDRCTYLHCDVTDEEQVKSAVETTVKNYGRLDVVFSNAGIIHTRQSILDLDLNALDQLYFVNVRGMAATIKHAGRAMVEGHVKGSIVCTASVASCYGGGGRHDYTMSKHAVLGLVRSVCVELGKHGIRVNCVSPYAVATPLLCKVNGLDEESVERLYAPYPSLTGIMLKANHVADAVLFLASDDSVFVSGHNLVVDGGFLHRG